MDFEAKQPVPESNRLQGNGGQQETTKDSTSEPTYEFNFPFAPYDVQLDLMGEAYKTFEQSKFALLESPTGTGKSLSLICSSLTWLKDYQRKVRKDFEDKKQNLLNKIEDLKKEEETTGDWLSVQSKRRDLSKELTDLDKELDKIIKFELKSQARRHAKLHGIPLENYASIVNTNDKSSDGALTFDDIRKNFESNLISSSQESGEIEEDLDIEKKVSSHDNEEHIRPKIFYASRTHSQLIQFVKEVKKTKFANSDEGPPIKVVPLASRANLCVNLEVVKLRDPSAINERCMELQKETKVENRCPYVKLKQVAQLKDDILSSVQDIEDLVNRGRAIGSCPYYATRMAIPEAELVVLPYNNLLHRETRQASSLDLKESIVIVDEAHNILETICSIHSAPITGIQLINAHTIFSRYYQRCHSRMSPRNAVVIKTIVHCLKTLISYLDKPIQHLKNYDCPTLVDLNDDGNTDNNCTNKQLVKSGDGKLHKVCAKHEELMIDITKFIGASGVGRFNIYKILDFLNRSQLARKLLGFFRQDSTIDIGIELHGLAANIDKTPNPKDTCSPKKKKRKTLNKTTSSKEKVVIEQIEISEKDSTSLNFLNKSNIIEQRNLEQHQYPIYTLIEFLKALTNLADDGKIHTDYYEGNVFKSSLKFILLNPSSQFRQMTQEARSVVLAGGTMQPFDEFKNLLFGPLGIDDGRLTLFSCGHVISHKQLFVASLANGSTGKPLELNYKVRSSFDAIDEIGRTIMNISMVSPGGMVCFMPSYDYEQLCFNRWCQIGLISKIETRSKHVFREPRQATNLKIIWDEYCKKIEQGKSIGRGALLLCVVGGKMSEGINFNDDLGRCVVMVGLPYANIKSSELQQKMGYYDRMCKRPSGDKQQQSAGQQYYENLCLKGINQSIGRAIRHKLDYAAIILIDRRYSVKSSIKDGLPNWMNKSLKDYNRFDDMLLQLGEFFSSIRNKID